MLFLSLCLLCLNMGEWIGRDDKSRSSAHSLNFLMVVVLVVNSLAQGFCWSQPTTIVLRMLSLILLLGLAIELFR